LGAKFSGHLFFDRDSNPLDIPLPEWTSMWWRWLHSIPANRNPASDSTGKFCGESQHNSRAWFLAGTLGDSVIRKCSIPHGRAILFPIITCIFSFVLDPHLKTEEQLKKSVRKDINTVEHLRLTIDEINITKLNRFRVISDPFDDIIDGVETRSVSDGYWIFLRPPEIGDHTIYFSAKNVDFFNEVKYYVSIGSGP
jgi:hypothetical protein